MLLLRRKLTTEVTAAAQQEVTTATVVRRARPGAQAAVEVASTPSRRVPLAGSTADNFARTAKAKTEVEAQLKLISNAYHQIDEAQLRVDQAFKVIEAQLRLVNLKQHSDGVYLAALEEVWSRQTRTIDPKKFRAQVAADVFWKSIKVSIEQAKELLTEKELTAMCDITPSKMNGIHLKVEKIDTKKRGKVS